MQGCLKFAKTLRAGAVFVGLVSFGITTVMAAPAAVKSKTFPTKVEIFTTDAFPITGIEELKRLVGEKNVIVYALDGVDKVEKEFPIVGAKTKANAVALGGQILKQNRQEITRRVGFGFQGLYRAVYEYGLKKYPAIIIDQAFVAYGTQDAIFALQKYRERVALK